MTGEQSAYYYRRNDAAPIDLTADINRAIVTDEYNCISGLELTLRNDDGKYSAWDAVGYGLERNRDISYSLGGIERFNGFLVSKRPNIRDGTIVTQWLGNSEILRRRALRCWARAFVSQSIYDIITAGTRRITYKTQDSGAMSVGGAKAQLGTAGVVSDAKTGIVLDFFKMPVSSSVFATLNTLANLLGYYYYVTKTIGSGPGYATNLDLTFQAKGTSSNTYVAILGEDLAEDNIYETEIEHAERVAVYGSKELAIAAEQGVAWEDSAHDYEETNEIYVAPQTVFQRCAYLYTILNAAHYEGDVLVTRPQTYSINPTVDDILQVINPQAKRNAFYRISKRQIIVDSGGFEIRVSVDANPYGYSKSLAEIRQDLLTLDTFRRDTTNPFESCVLNASDNYALAEQRYAVKVPAVITAAENPSPYGAQITWSKPTILNATDFTADTFQKYEVRQSLVPGVKITDNLIHTELNENITTYFWLYPILPPFYFRVFAYYAKTGITPTNEANV